MSRSLLLVVLFLAVTAACGGEEEIPIPDIAGHYNLVAQQQDSDCLPEVATGAEIFAFMDEAAAGIPVMTMDLSQDDGEILAGLGPSGCVWSGVVDNRSSLTLNGPCNDPDLARIGHLAGTLEPNSGGWELDGSLLLEIDSLDASGAPGPDGVTDCEVLLDIEGTGI